MKLGQRIIIVGNTGSGKTTLAQALSQRLTIPHTEIDALHWDENWTKPTPDEFRRRIEQAITPEQWILDGNYSSVRDLIWRRADTLIWLDYAMPVILWQLIRRTIRRVWSQEVLWNNNRETWRGALFSRDSLFVWAFKKQWSRRKLYPTLLQQPEYAHLTIFRWRSPRQMRQWLAEN